MKTRRNFIAKISSIAALFAVSSRGLVAEDVATAPLLEPGGMNGKFYHVVFFWLINKEEETRNRFLSELRNFIDDVDLIKTRHIGSPADTNRSVIDATYSYSLILTFDSKEEQDLYQEHQLHKVFIENASSLWNKVQVYDSLELSH